MTLILVVSLNDVLLPLTVSRLTLGLTACHLPTTNFSRALSQFLSPPQWPTLHGISGSKIHQE